MKDFKPTSWAIDNRTTIFVLTILITLAGLSAYNSLPKEQFPDIVVPTIFVSTIYPGASPKDMETLVTKPIEKQLKGINGVKKVTSSSIQDFSSIIVEFNTDLDVQVCKQKVKDGVDKSKRDLPTDLLDDPAVTELEFSEVPIMNVNLSGDYSLDKLKDYADALQDKIEEFREITRVDIVGALEKEVKVDLDKYKMEAAQLTFNDVANAIAYENMTISAGNVTMDGMTRSVSISGEFKDVEQVKNILVSSQSGAQVYLKDIADVRMGHKDRESYSRLRGKNVVVLNVIKRGGENLISASDKIKAAVEEMQKTEFPAGLNVSITADQSRNTRTTLHDLINTIVIGFILVTLILMFFMGLTDALFVAMSVPLSMFIAFMCLPSVGFTLNMIVLFSFLLGLGIVVDDAIVVIENTHRIYHEEQNLNITQAAKKAAAEVFLPVLSGTATTLAPFFPLVFWGGLYGKFMHFLPVTLIITLTASLLVAYLINPVFAASFMGDPKREVSKVSPEKKRRRLYFGIALYVLATLGFYFSGNIGLGNFAVFIVLFWFFYKYVLSKAVVWFQKKGWPAVQNVYGRFLEFQLKRPWSVLIGMVVLLFASLFISLAREANIEVFPKSEPNFIFTYLTMPVGTDIAVTDSLTKILEKKVTEVVGADNPIVESIQSNVALGASEDQFDRTSTSNKGKVGVAFVEFGTRNSESTRAYMDKIRDATRGLIPGAEIVVDQEQGGPPAPKPISVEIRGDDFEKLVSTSVALKKHLDAMNIGGVEELRSDLITSKPEINIRVDRDRASREGISTAQIGSEFRTAILGKEASKFRDGEDEIPITVRLKKEQRDNINAVENLPVTFRDMNMGGVLRSVPMAALADVKYSTTFGGIRRKDQMRMVTLASNITTEFQPKQTSVINEVKAGVASFPKVDGVTIAFAGEDQDAADAGAFLGRSLLISLCLILVILLTQFNSVGRVGMIMVEVLFSIIGVLLGLAIFDMTFSIIMMGVGIVALAGIVVRNGILLVEFTDTLRERGLSVHDAVVEAGRIRMTPVLLTATATIIGLIPLAVGFNIDFASLFSTGNPKIFFGGDSVAFWGPLSWTIVFGLGFATFITLVVLPVMYLLIYRNRKD